MPRFGKLALLLLIALPAGRAAAQETGTPVFLAALLLAAVALSPRITLGDDVLVDLSAPWVGRLAVFRATGRFFWPLAYLLLASTVATVVARVPSRVALSLLLATVTVQAVDLHGAHEARRRSARDPNFYAWDNPMASPVWHEVLPAYDHLVLYPPPQCGSAPVSYEGPAYLAGLHGLTINTGGVARPDEAARLRYCHELGDEVKAGRLDERSLYLVPPAEVDAIRTVIDQAADFHEYMLSVDRRKAMPRDNGGGLLGERSDREVQGKENAAAGLLRQGLDSVFDVGKPVDVSNDRLDSKRPG